MGNEPVAFLCSSKREIEEIVGVSRRTSNGEEFSLVLKNDGHLLKRLLPAFMNAKIRYEESEMKASTMQMEILLFIAGTLRTEKAIAECGAKRKDEFVLFASGKGFANRFAKEAGIRLGKEYKLDLDLDAACAVASTGLLED